MGTRGPRTVAVSVDKGWSWMVCVAGFIVTTLTGGTVKSQGLMFVAYMELFGQGEAATGWFAFAAGITTAIVALVGGYVADALTHTRKRIALVVLFPLITLDIALAGYMPNMQLTIMVFAILGFLWGVEDPISMSMLSRYFDKWRTIAFGVAVTGVGAGGMVLPLVFNAASETFGFRGTMLILAALWLHGTLMAAVTWPLPTKAVVPGEDEVDVELVEPTPPTGSDAENGTDRCPVLAKSDSMVDPEEPASSRGASTEEEDTTRGSKQKHTCQMVCGILDNYRKFLSNPKVPFLLVSCELGAFAYLGGYFLIPLLAQELQLTKTDVSYIFTAGGILDMAVKIPIGLLVDKAGIPKGGILLVSSGVYGVGSMILSFVSNPYVLYGHALLIGGFGGSVLQLLIPLFVDAVDETQRGTASAMLAFVAGIAGALPPVVLGAVKTSFGSYVHSLRACSVAALLTVVVYSGTFLIAPVKKCASNREGISARDAIK